MNREYASQVGMRYAVRSTCWGAISQVMVRDSSLIVIFAALIGAGEVVGVLSTGILDLALCVLMLPLAALSDRIGVQRQIILAVWVSIVALLLAAAAPWFGVAPGLILLSSLLVFAVAIGAYSSAWLPMLERVVPPAERGLFFGRMRFAWQLTSMIFVLGAGWYVGRYATVGRLQIVMAAGALAGLGRIYYVSRIPLAAVAPPQLRLGASLLAALRNRSLAGFGVYLFFLYFSANSTVPVVFVFARNRLLLSDRLVVLLSVASMCGLLAGFPLGGRLVHRYGSKGMLLAAHVGFTLLNFLLLSVHAPGAPSAMILMAILLVYGCLFAGASVAVSSELLALAAPGNKAVSIALGYSLYAAGMGISRLVSSLVLGSGMLAETWTLRSLVLSRYHTLFLTFGVGSAMAMLLLIQVPGLIHRVETWPTTN